MSSAKARKPSQAELLALLRSAALDVELNVISISALKGAIFEEHDEEDRNDHLVVAIDAMAQRAREQISRVIELATQLEK
jgi:hypothetical protein